MKTRSLLVLLLIGAPALSGCVTVSPYEREYLSRPSMDVEREASEEGFKTHVFDSREGAMGGYGSTGGGCGCN